MKSILSVLFSFFAAGIVHAVVPNELPLTRAAATINALTRSVNLDRNVWAYPMGEVKIYDPTTGAKQTNFKRTQLQRPVNGGKILSAVNSDRFKVSLPTYDMQFNTRYTTYDEYGNPLLSASTGGKATKVNGVYKFASYVLQPTFSLEGTFWIEADASGMSVQTLDDEGQIDYHNLIRKEVGGKTFFALPSWWLDWSDFKRGITYAYGLDESGAYSYKEFVNQTGKLTGTQTIDYTPVAGFYNHFDVLPSASGNELVIPSWGNHLNNPSFELKASEGIRNATLFVQTSEGARPTGIILTTQDSLGNTTKVELPMAPTGNYGWTQFLTNPGHTYYFYFVWPETVIANEAGLG